LLFERLGPPVPEERLQECNIPQARGGAPHFGTTDTEAASATIREAKVRVVTTGARHGVVRGQQGIEEKISAQVDLLW